MDGAGVQGKDPEVLCGRVSLSSPFCPSVCLHHQELCKPSSSLDCTVSLNGCVPPRPGRLALVFFTRLAR